VLPQSDATLDEEEDPILRVIGYDPVHIDDLVVRLGSDIATVSAEILALELSGKLSNCPVQSYVELNEKQH